MREKSKAIDEKLEEVAKSWYARSQEIDKSIEEERRVLMSDEAHVDRRENAMYQIAADNFARLQISKRDITTKIAAYENYRKEYIPSDTIAVGTTVHLELINDNRDFYVKIVPPDLGCARIGAITTQSAVGKSILGKYTGDEVKVLTRRGEVTYRIKEVY